MKCHLLLLISSSVFMAALASAQIAFGPASSIPSGIAGGAVSHSAAIDLDGDRFPELVTVDEVTDQLSIHTNLGGGNFSLLTVLSTGTTPRDVIGVDLDGDGLNDIVVSNSGSNDVTYFRNLGAGAFAAGSSFAVGTAPIGVVAFDANGDSFPDLATANSGSSDISVLINLGGGSLLAASQSATTAGSAPRALAAADFNGDGAIDLAVANRNTENISIMTNSGSGVFAETASVPTGSSLATGIVAADIDQDGNIDVVASSFLPPNLVFARNVGPVFIPNIFSDGVHLQGLDTLDADVDGDVDLVTAEFAFNSARIVENVGGVLMGSGVSVATTAPSAILAADFDGDFVEDLAITRSAGNDVGIAINALPVNVLGDSARSRMSDGANGTFDMLRINGSAGGVQRRVDTTNNTTATFEALQPPTLGFPAPFLIWAQIGAPTLATVTDLGILDLGELCIQPSSLIPGAAGAFLFANNFGGNDPNAATRSASTPWSAAFLLPPFPFSMAIQGLSLDGPTDIRVTNGVLLEVM